MPNKPDTSHATMTPREIVQDLDRHIVRQQQAKRAVAIALRNRWRRAPLDAELRTEVMPKNIPIVAPTGVGKTEIARPLATPRHAPFAKVPAPPLSHAHTNHPTMTPREIVQELDRHIVGQQQAKRAVAIALRNRWRRAQLDDELRNEVMPKNILMVGPTGVGKTEIARRLATLANAPFVKVEATRFTEVGYVGKDVEQIIRDLADTAVKLYREQAKQRVRTQAEERAEDRILDALLPRREVPSSGFGFGASTTVDIGAEPSAQGNSDKPTTPASSCAGSCAQATSTIARRSEEHTSELQTLMRISYAV